MQRSHVRCQNGCIVCVCALTLDHNFVCVLVPVVHSPDCMDIHSVSECKALPCALGRAPSIYLSCYMGRKHGVITQVFESALKSML